MKCYKGFDKDLRCKDFQYEIGKEYETERAEICEEGFHACEFPLDVLRYYNPADSRFCEVELDANEQTRDDCCKDDHGKRRDTGQPHSGTGEPCCGRFVFA